jgi:AraC-like DNA-binding protein
MIINNIHDSYMFNLLLGNIDSKLGKGAFGPDKSVLTDFSAMIVEEHEAFKNRTDERIFFENVITVVQKKVADESFDFRQFAIEMNVSKSTLHRKINQFTGLTPCKLVLSYRIQIAQQLLLNNSFNISEVAYRIGFNDPRYFSRCFRNEVGISPKKYRESMKPKSTNDQNNDQLFLEKALEKLETKIAEGSLSFDQFANEMNVSKASLYRKLKSVVGLSPCEFIRSVRIKRSAQLLAKHSNISEVAFAVGFNDSKYFSRCFKSEFGVTPTQYQELLAC